MTFKFSPFSSLLQPLVSAPPLHHFQIGNSINLPPSFDKRNQIERQSNGK